MASAALPSPVLPEDGAEAWDELSPDGRTLVRWQLSHGRMSHFMVTPALHDAETGAPILELDSGFDAQLRWLEGGRFTFNLRHYWRSGLATLEIDRTEERFRFIEPGAEPERWLPIGRISDEVEARFTPSNAAIGQRSKLFWAKLAANRIAPAQRRAARLQLALVAAAVAAAAIWWLAW